MLNRTCSDEDMESLLVMEYSLLERWRDLGFGANLSLLEVAFRFDFGDMYSEYGFNCWYQRWNGENCTCP